MAASGSYPEAWDGRSAEEEEARLRESGEWPLGKLDFFEAWGEVDPVSALNAARETDRDSITSATVAALRGWAGKDPVAARDWVDAQPETAERTLYVRGMLEAEELGEGDALAWDERGRWLANQVDLPGVHPVLVEHLVSLGTQDREAALLWMKDAVVKPEQRQLIADLWMRHDFAADESLGSTTEWLEKHEDGEVKDAMLFAFVKEAVRADPATALRWAELIGAEELRAAAEALCEPE